MLDEFADFLTDTVTIEPFVSRDAYGLATYGAGVAYACRIDGATRQRVTVEGVERSAQAAVYLPGVPAIGPGDRLTLPAGFAPAQPPILRVAVFTDEAGPHHTELLC